MQQKVGTKISKINEAIEFHNKGDLKKAKDLYVEILEEDPKNPDALHLLGRVYGAFGEFDLAKNFIKRSLAERPEHAETHIGMGNLYFSFNKISAAIKSYNKAKEIDDKCYDAYNNLGVAYSRQNNSELAIDAFARAIFINPNSASAYTNLADTLTFVGKYEDAIAACLTSLNIDDQSAETLYNLGNALQKVNDYKNAETAFAKAISLKPNYVEAYNNLGNVYSDQGNWQKAIGCYVKVLDQIPNSELALKNIANALNLVGRTGEALQAYSKAIHVVMSRPKVNKRQVKTEFSNDTKPREALLSFAKIMDDNGLPFFPCFGTLLGFVRENNFLSFDKDIDVGILPGIKQQQVIDLINVSEDFKLSYEHSVKDDSLLLCAKHNNGISIDIFFHADQGNDIVAGVDNAGEKFLWKFKKFGLTKKLFLEHNFYIPDAAELYLNQMYGDWQEPDPYFNSYISCKNAVYKQSPIAKVVAYSGLYDALRGADYEKALAYCKQYDQFESGNSLIEKIYRYLEL